MRYILFDLEATCWENPEGRVSEIIEIGAVKIDGEGRLSEEFCAFVKPQENPLLSPFCISLTHILQEDVDNAEKFPEVAEKFRAWIMEGGEPYMLCAWGQYDQNQLMKDCKLHGLNGAWLSPYWNIKKKYAKKFRHYANYGLKTSVLREGFEFEGQHHRGIDDAKNLAKIFLKYFGCWKTESLGNMP